MHDGEVFFDLRKAFDAVPHSLSKLERVGLDPFYCNVIHNYLAERRQSVGTSSLTVDVIQECPKALHLVLSSSLFYQ